MQPSFFAVFPLLIKAFLLSELLLYRMQVAHLAKCSKGPICILNEDSHWWLTMHFLFPLINIKLINSQLFNLPTNPTHPFL